MQTALSIMAGIVVVLFYLSNPKNKINVWFSIAMFFFWIGVSTEAVIQEIIPLLEAVLGVSGLGGRFDPINSVCIWMLYTLGTPTLLLAIFYFNSIDRTHPQQMRFKFATYIPAVVISLFFVPINCGEYQLHRPFWVAYAIYNFCFGIAVAFMAVRGARKEKNSLAKKQKQRVALVFLPPLFYWLISLFIPRLMLPLDSQNILFDLYKANIIILLISVIVFIAFAFKDGFMGLKLVTHRYNWNDTMDLINMSAEYTNHMFKQQVATMELCIKQLNERFISSDSSDLVVDRLGILSRSILTLKNFIDRIKRHSQIIYISETPCKLTDLLADAVLATKSSGISISIDIPVDLIIICDKVHMTEVFTNIITNAIEAANDNGIIEITGAYEKSKYQLMFKDNGAGIDSAILDDVFKPHFSTKKSKEKNFGLGLYYCKNVITAHGGSILAKSILGQETTIIITFSSKRVYRRG